MTPKEKAKELVDRFSDMAYGYDPAPHQWKYAQKECALICVDEQRELLQELIDCMLQPSAYVYSALKELSEVKQEIEKL